MELKTMDTTTKTLFERFKELPQEIQEYVKGDTWNTKAQQILNKHSLDAEQSESVKFEMFLYLLLLQNEKELTQQIQDTLSSIPKPISGVVAQELLSVIPEKIKDINKEFFAENDTKEKGENEPAGETTDTEQTPTKMQEKTTPSDKATPENLPTETTAPNKAPETQPTATPKTGSQDTPTTNKAPETFKDESSAGIDILPQEAESENITTPDKDSLIQSIEHPEDAEKIEKAAKQRPSSFNPVTSKLGGATKGAGEQTTPNTPHYGGADPYREPIN